MAECEACGTSFELTQPSRRYCSRNCGALIRNRAYRAAHPTARVVLAPRTCATCGTTFDPNHIVRIYCSVACRDRAEVIKRHKPQPPEIRCANCQTLFRPRRADWTCCSTRCTRRLQVITATTRRMVKRAANGTLRPEKSRSYRDDYTPQEIAALRADPSCVLPNRSLAAQWRKCRRLGIPRDPSLRIRYQGDPEKEARRRKPSKEACAARNRRWYFRTRVRANPGPILDELRRLAGRHPHAEDLVEEAFATVLCLAIPAAEAFALAKKEVNRTSAQPFREQSFNPEIDYEARETGRQVARASDIRAARGGG